MVVTFSRYRPGARGQAVASAWLRLMRLPIGWNTTYTLACLPRCRVVNKDNVVEQRQVQAGQLVGDLRVIDKGLTKDDRVVIGGIMRAIPGQKVDADLSSPAAKN